MTPFRFRLVATLAAALTTLPAHAAVCAVDPVPASTLLVPYFHFGIPASCQLNLLTYRDTQVWFHNTADESTLTRVTLWSRAGIPALDFLVYLQGRESYRFSFLDLVCSGELPRSGPGETNTSRFSLLGTPSLNACNNSTSPGVPPMYAPLTTAQRADLRLALSGKPVAAAGGCYAPDAGDDLLRGYVTVDVVHDCTAGTPADAAYATTLAHANVLVGGFLLFDGATLSTYGGAAVALESAPAGRFGQDASTFHGRYAGFAGTDRREPLPSTWMAPFAHSGASGNDAEFIVWREVPPLTPSMALCAGASAGGEIPLETREQRLFDAGGDSQPTPQAPPATIPLATQRIPAVALENTSTRGDARRGLAYVQLTDGTADPRLGQGWLGALVTHPGRHGELLPGVPLDSRCAAGSTTPADTRGPTPVNPNVPGYFWADGFED